MKTENSSGSLRKGEHDLDLTLLLCCVRVPLTLSITNRNPEKLRQNEHWMVKRSYLVLCFSDQHYTKLGGKRTKQKTRIKVSWFKMDIIWCCGNACCFFLCAVCWCRYCLFYVVSNRYIKRLCQIFPEDQSNNKNGKRQTLFYYLPQNNTRYISALKQLLLNMSVMAWEGQSLREPPLQSD